MMWVNFNGVGYPFEFPKTRFEWEGLKKDLAP